MYINVYQRSWFKALSAFAWLTLVFGGLLTLVDYQTKSTSAPDLTLFHIHSHFSGVLLRLIDEYSYFTNWSVLAVALTFTKLAYGKSRITTTMKILIPTTLLMIIITGILYNTLIAPSNPPQGLFVYSSACEHIITPILTVIVWIAVGPHTMIFKKIPQYFVIPIIYVLYIAARGSIDHQYPYGFLNAAAHGYKGFLLTSIEILIFGFVLLLILVPIDRVLAKRES